MAARDVLILGIVLFSAACVMVPFYLIYTNIHSALVANPQIAASQPTVDALGGLSSVAESFDYIVFALFIGYTLSVLITGWLIGGHPVFVFAYFVMIVIAVIVAAVLSNSWEALSESPEIIGVLPHFGLTNNLLTYLPVYSAIVGFLGVVVMYGKPFLGGGEGR